MLDLSNELQLETQIKLDLESWIIKILKLTHLAGRLGLITPWFCIFVC